MGWDALIKSIPADRPVLIAGPTASGKSGLALAIADAQGGRIINADALQVFADWRILTARPSPEDEASVRHALYGHVQGDQPYSVGTWLAEITPLLSDLRPIIVGGTGLYFSALTEGLADIPDVPDHIADTARHMAETDLAAMVAEIDAKTAARIDLQNPRRVQRAWEVLTTTGRGLADWQDDTGPAPLPLDQVTALCLEAPKDWLIPRIEARFDQMLGAGLLDEARGNLPHWDPNKPSSKAIGAADVIDHLKGRLDCEQMRNNVVIQTRQYAKRQRNWFRGRMKGWRWIDPVGANGA